MSRRDTNEQILLRLAEIVNRYPDLRFGQILFNFVLSYAISENNCHVYIDDPYYEESNITLNRLKTKIKERNDLERSSS